MNEVPPSEDESNDIDERYRQASAPDTSRPDESTRRAILEYAAQRAAEKAPKNDARHKLDFTQRAANQPWWRPAIVGSLAAAALAGLLITPHFLKPSVPTVAEVSPTQTLRQQPAVAARAPAALPATAAQSFEQRPAEADTSAKSAGTARDAAAGNLAMESNAGGASRGGGSHAMSAQRSKMAASAAPAAQSRESANLLRRAAEIGDIDALHAQLENQAAVDARDDGGRTALMLATLHGQRAAVDALLANGADPNAADASGMTPLQVALAGGQSAIVESLLQSGAR